jgi:GGDEF domain-containing protein
MDALPTDDELTAVPPDEELTPAPADGPAAAPALAAAPAPAPGAEQIEPAPPDEELTPKADVENAGLAQTFKAALQEAPDKKAGVLQLARGLGVDTGVAEARYDELKATWEASKLDPAAWRQANPELAKIALEDPHVGQVVMRDAPVSVFTSAINGLWDSFVTSTLTSEYGWRAYELEEKAKEGPLSKSEQLELDIAKGAIETNAEDRAAKAVAKPRQVPMMQDGKTRVMQDLGWAAPVVRTIARYQETAAQLEVDKLQFELLTRRSLNQSPDETYELEKRILDAKNQLVVRDYGEGAWGQVVTDIAQGGASQVAVLKDVAGAGIVGAVAGGIVGAAVGEYTGTGPVKGALKGAAKGASWLGKAGGALASLKLEAGSAYGELLDATKDDGTKLTEEEARGGALVYGGIAAIVELWSTEEFIKSLGPLGKGMLAGEGSAVIADLTAHDASLRTVMAKVGKEYAHATSAEAAEELVQQAAQQLVTYLTKSKSQGKMQQGPVFNTDELLESFWKGGLAAGGTGVGAAGVHLATQLVSKARMQQAGQQVAHLAGLAASDSPTIRAAPEAVAQLVAEKTAADGRKVTHLYVDAQAFTKLFQDEKADPAAAAAQLMGEEGPAQLQRAVATGGKLEVPVAQYLERWGGSEVASRLAEDTATQLGDSTPRQLEEQAKAIDSRAQELVKEYQKEGAKPAEGAEAAYVDALESALINGKKMTPEQARHQVGPHRAFVASMAEAFHIDPAELFQGFTVRLDQGETTPSIAAVTQQLGSKAKLEQRAKTLTGPERVAESYLDNNTGLLNERAFDETPAPADKPMVGHISVEGIKYVNDEVNHDKGDLLYRMAAKALHQVDPLAAKKGGDFAVRVGSQAELDQVVAKMNELMPVKGFTVTGVAGADFKAAGELHDAAKDAAVAAGTRAKRGERPLLQGDAKDLVLPEEKAAAVVPEALTQRVQGLSPEDYFKERYQDQTTGAWTAEGWAALPRKKHVVAFDLKGLKKANKNFGELTGDRLIRAFQGHRHEVRW